MRRPTTISTPDSVAIGIRDKRAERDGDDQRHDAFDNSGNPRLAPLERLTRTGAHGPGARHAANRFDDTTLAKPCAASSRSGSWRVRVI